MTSARMRVDVQPGFPPAPGPAGVPARGSAAGDSARAGAAEVTLEYRFSGVAPGEAVPLSFLRFGQARLGALRTAVMRVTPPPASARRTTFEVPAEAAPAGGSAADSDRGYAARTSDAPARLTLRYQVTRAVARDGRSQRVHVPVLSVPWPPEEARPGTFRVEVRVPPDWKVTQVFPTSLRPSAADPGLLVGELPVVPSVITVRARAGSGGLPTLPRVLDVLAAIALVAISWTGWRHMRSRT